jgi:hypothetical protein
MDITTSILKRLYGRCEISQNTGCWVFGGAKNTKGYGNIYVSGKMLNTHRLSYLIANDGKINEGSHVCHKCDNPACVNPDHLWEGSHKQNMDDRNRKQRTAKGESHGKAKLTALQVKKIKRQLAEGDPITSIATTSGMSRTAIACIARGSVWKEVEA